MGKKLIIMGVTLIVITLGLIGFLWYQIFRVGITRSIDNTFGDQHLKTSVSLIEMHKLRYGQYPNSLSDLKYLGEWDRIHTQPMNYVVSKERDKYCVEVGRGWVAKPDFKMPEEFWRNTGYEPSLCQ